uniref:Uncharacterized protein n=1 Tax=Nothoprocta perdicaria TaxID=30464 RepID=A0A8C6YQK8_NOTPE
PWEPRAAMGARGYLLLALLLQRAGRSRSGLTGTVGKSVTFRIPGPMEGRLYWHVKNLLMVIINSSGYPEVLDAKYAERMAFLHNGTALILSGLVPDDAGTYWVQVLHAELPPPAVSCSLANCTAAPCPYELLCSAPGAAVAYGWSGAGALNASGPWLQLRRPLRSLPPVTCTARNPVSSSNVTVQPAAACAGSAADPEALTVYASVGTANQVSPPPRRRLHRCSHQHSLGNSHPLQPAPQDPAQAAKAPEEASKTIYSTVQPAVQVSGAAGSPADASASPRPSSRFPLSVATKG